MKSIRLRTAIIRSAASLGAGLALAIAGVANATPVDPGLAGNTQYDEWANLTGANYPGYGGGFPGAAAWPAPIGSNVAGSGDADLSKVSGNAYTAAEAIYHGGFSSIPNSSGGTLAVSDATPLADVKTIVLQVEIGEAFGYDFFNDTTPVLSYNGGGQGIAADSASIISQYQNGTFVNPDTGLEEPVYVNTWMMTWDVSALGAVTSLALQWTGVQHSQVYAARLDQSDIAVPEPGTISLAMLGLSGIAAIGRARRRA